MISRSTNIQAALAHRLSTQRGFLLNPFRFGNSDHDPYWSSVKALVHGSGASIGSAIIDKGNSSRTWENTNTVLSTDYPDGDVLSSVHISGTSFLRATTAVSDLRWTSSSEYTAEIFAYLPTLTNNQWLMGQMNPQSNTADWGLLVGTDQAFSIYYWTGSTVWVSSLTQAVSLSHWHHFAMSVSSGTVRIFLDGVMVASATAGSPTNSVSAFAVGRPYSGSQDFLFHDLRITNGVARYTSDFTPPSAPFPNS